MRRKDLGWLVLTQMMSQRCVGEGYFFGRSLLGGWWFKSTGTFAAEFSLGVVPVVRWLEILRFESGPVAEMSSEWQMFFGRRVLTGKFERFLTVRSRGILP